MIKNKKGFTLIELLATIVILGLLALIVTPGIAKVIKNSKINTAKASLEGYVREIENASALYLTDTGKYPSSIDVLELDGKNIDEIKNPSVTLNNGSVEKITAEIDGLYCSYEIGKDTVCSLEPLVKYSYIKHSDETIEEIAKTLNEEYEIGFTTCPMIPTLLGLQDIKEVSCSGEELEIWNNNEEEINELLSSFSINTVTFYGLPIDKIKTLEYTNQRPEGEGLDISKDNKNDVLMFYTTEDDMYNVKIYSENIISFPKYSTMYFGMLTGLDSLILDNIDTSNVVDMSMMFAATGAISSVFSLALGDNFDTSNVTNMSAMFSLIINGICAGSNSPAFTLNLGNKFDTSKVTNMLAMFMTLGNRNPNFELNLGNKFNTLNVNNMMLMFSQLGYNNTNFTLDLSTFDTSNVTNMAGMFKTPGDIKTIYVSDKWTTDAVTNSEVMFDGCTSLPNFDANVIDKTNAHYGEGGYLTLKK